MSVIPWVACNPSPPAPADSIDDPGSGHRRQAADSDHFDDGSPPPPLPPLSPVATSKPLFLFTEGVESKDGDAKSLRGFAPVEMRANDQSVASSSVAAGTGSRPGEGPGQLSVAEASASRALSLRPLEVKNFHPCIRYVICSLSEANAAFDSGLRFADNSWWFLFMAVACVDIDVQVYHGSSQLCGGSRVQNDVTIVVSCAVLCAGILWWYTGIPW